MTIENSEIGVNTPETALGKEVTTDADVSGTAAKPTPESPETEKKTSDATPEKENTAARTRNAFLRSREAARRIRADADGVKEAYPEFELRNALCDIRIRAMLKSGIPLKTAYEAVNFERIVAERERKAAETARGTLRPVEGGARAQSGSVSGLSVSRLTRAEREKLALRAVAGEEIKL